MSQFHFYQDLELINQPGISLGVVWSKLYTQLHIALADLKNQIGKQPVAVSFPEYGDTTFPLGFKLRLLAVSEDELHALNISLWLSRLTDYVKVKPIRMVPQKRINGYAIFGRKQVKGRPETIAKRRARKDPNISYEDALRLASQKNRLFSQLPYVSLNSSTSGQYFKLFIFRKECSAENTDMDFSSYGLSNQCAVPIF